MNKLFPAIRQFLITSKFIWNHPVSSRARIRGFYNYFSWQLIQNIRKHSTQCKLVESSKLVIEKGMAGATGVIYVGLPEFEEMAFILHVLRQNDRFVDVGANVGVYTILASKNCGAESYTFEPIPKTYRFLERNVSENKISDKVHLFNCGVGKETGELLFTEDFDTINHVINDKTENNKGLLIPVVSLDNIFSQKSPQVIKIDVEGYETEVLRGAMQTLISHETKALIIETNGSGARYSKSDMEIHMILTNCGYAAYNYLPYKRELQKVNFPERLNTIYIKDLEWVTKRINSAPKFKKFGVTV